MKKLLVMASLVSLTGVAHAYDCENTRKIDRVVDIQSAGFLKVEAGAGTLEIVGSDRKDVRIKAVLCSNDEDVLAQMDIVADVSSKKAHFETKMPRRSVWGNKTSASIDLILLVPESSEMEVRDSSGEANIEKVAKLDMTDSSGSLEIKDIGGDLRVVDSSGAMEIEDVAGDVNLTDSSGGIYVSNVGGNMVVEADSSGEIEARHVAKDVLIKIDSSGQIDVKDVGGDFTVEKDTSGGVFYKQVAGKVNI